MNSMEVLLNLKALFGFPASRSVSISEISFRKYPKAAKPVTEVIKNNKYNQKDGLSRFDCQTTK